MLRSTGARQTLVVNAVLATGYAALGTVSLMTVRETGLAAPVWPAAGLALAVLLVYGWRVAPGIVLGSLAVNIPAVLQDQRGVVVALGVPLIIAMGAALQASTGALLVRREVGPRPALLDGRSILRFLLLAGPVACVVAPTVGLVAQLSGGVIPPSSAVVVWLTWWVGDSIGVVIAAPIVLMLLPPTRHAWRGRHLKIIVPSLVMLLGITWVFLLDASVQRTEQRNELVRVGVEARTTLQRALERQAESLQGVDGLFAASEYVSAREFRSFTAHALQQSDGLSAIAWDAVVPEATRTDFTARMRLEEGVTSFTITQRAPGGGLVPADVRPEHVVVTYIEPIASNAAALGFDIMSDPDRAAAAVAARDTGTDRATAPVDLVSDADQQKGVLVLHPVYRDGVVPPTPAQRAAAIEGYAVGIYRLGDLLRASFSDQEWSDIDVTLRDVTPGSEPVTLAAHDMGGTPSGEPSVQQVPVGGRVWELVVQPTSATPWALPPTYSVGLLVGGLLVTVLLEAFLLLLTGTERQARREAELQGYEANHDALTGLYNRRAFIDLLGAARSRADAEASRHVLLYMDLDGFKAVNDSSGHEVGDAMLQSIAEALRARVRDRDVVARIGGDEFAAILSNCPQSRGEEIARVIVEGVEAARPARFPAAPHVSVSVGLTMIDGAEPASVDELLHQADLACYAAKSAGRGQVRAHVPATVDHSAR